MTHDGPCEVCTGPDVGLLLVAILVALTLLWCVYWVIAHENRAKRKKAFTFVGIVGSQFVTVFQMLGVMMSLSFVWPEPFATLVELGSVTNFRLEFLNLHCVVTAPAVQRYLWTIFSFVALVLCMVAFHVVYVLIFHHLKFRRGEFREFRSALVVVSPSCASLNFFLMGSVR